MQTGVPIPRPGGLCLRMKYYRQPTKLKRLVKQPVHW